MRQRERDQGPREESEGEGELRLDPQEFAEVQLEQLRRRRDDLGHYREQVPHVEERARESARARDQDWHEHRPMDHETCSLGTNEIPNDARWQDCL